jgi:hypothetical protein
MGAAQADPETLLMGAGTMYERTYGNRYDKSLDVKEIAKRLRKWIRARAKAGELPEGKYSVTIDRYSMGQSCDIRVKQCAAQMLNPAQVRFIADNPHTCVSALPVNHEARERYTPEGRRVLDELSNMLGAYNHDGSDSMTDLFRT